MKAAHTTWVLAQVLLPGAAWLALAAHQGRERDYAVAGAEIAHPLAHCDHLAGCLGADGQRIQPLGECHATEAPHIDVVQPDGTHAQLRLTRPGWRGRVALSQHEFSVGNKLQGANLSLLSLWGRQVRSNLDVSWMVLCQPFTPAPVCPAKARLAAAGRP